MGVEGQDASGRALKVALLGQPNVGKSSLFRALSVLRLVGHSDRQLELALFEPKGRRGM